MEKTYTFTLDKIRADLKDVRHYYSRKDHFDNTKGFVPKLLLDKVQKYDAAANCVPALYLDLYIALYIKNSTQEKYAKDLNFTSEYVRQLNKKLLLFLQSNLT